MTDDIHNLLRRIDNGTREEIWEAAKQLDSLVTDIVLFLIHLLQKGERPETRAAAAYTLGFGRFASARTSLEQVLQNTSEDASVRGHAAEALSYIQSRESVGVLLKQLDDKNPAVRYWCTFALGQIGDIRALAALQQLVDNTDDEVYEGHSLRNEAINAVAEIKQLAGAQP